MAAAVAVFAAAAFCWRRGWMGGADVKLLGAVTLLVPPVLVLNLLAAVSMAGGVLALIYLALRPLVGRSVAGRPAGPGVARQAGMLRRICRVELRRIRRRESLPYASAIAAGAILVMLPG
jgi:prepilin peptidase CpaA